jgi:hypothetical protein
MVYPEIFLLADFCYRFGIGATIFGRETARLGLLRSPGESRGIISK